MSRKLFITLTALTLLTLLFGACSPAKPQPTAAPAEPTSAQAGSGDESPTAAPPSGDEVVTIKVWDFGGVETEWLDSVIVPAFNEKYPNIKIEHLGIPEDDFATKLETAVAAGEVPDLALGPDPKLVKTGHMIALDDYMSEAGLRPDDYFPLFQSSCMIEGKVYALPVSIYTWGMIYNKDLFQAAGLPELDGDSVITYDDWLAYAKAISKPSDNLEERVWGSVHFVPRWNAMNNYMSDPYVLGPDGRHCAGNADNEDWVHMWGLLLTAYKEGLTADSSASLLGDTGFMDLFKQGQLGMMYGTYGDASAAQAAGVNVGFTGQPVVTKGWEHNVGSWLTSYSIMAASKHPKEAWLFLEFLTTDGAKMLSDARALDFAQTEVIGSPPAYKPLAEGWAGDDPLKQANLKMLDRVAPPPFSPGVWTSVGPFEEAWRRMTEDGVDAKTAISEAATECQEITDELWVEWEKLGR